MDGIALMWLLLILFVIVIIDMIVIVNNVRLRSDPMNMLSSSGPLIIRTENFNQINGIDTCKPDTPHIRRGRGPRLF